MQLRSRYPVSDVQPDPKFTRSLFRSRRVPCARRQGMLMFGRWWNGRISTPAHRRHPCNPQSHARGAYAFVLNEQSPGYSGGAAVLGKPVPAKGGFHFLEPAKRDGIVPSHPAFLQNIAGLTREILRKILGEKQVQEVTPTRIANLFPQVRPHWNGRSKRFCLRGQVHIAKKKVILGEAGGIDIRQHHTPRTRRSARHWSLALPNGIRRL